MIYWHNIATLLFKLILSTILLSVGLQLLQWKRSTAIFSLKNIFSLFILTIALRIFYTALYLHFL